MMFMGNIMLFKLVTRCFLFLVKSPATKTKDLSTVYSPALYAKQPVILPTESLLVFTRRPLSAVINTCSCVQEREDSYSVFTRLISSLLTVLYCKGSSFPNVSVSPPILHTPTHMQMHTRSTYTSSTVFSRCEGIDSRYVCLCSCRKGLTCVSSDGWCWATVQSSHTTSSLIDELHRNWTAEPVSNDCYSIQCIHTMSEGGLVRWWRVR